MKKSFDCVEMKNRLQAELREQEQGLGADEIRERRRQWLARGEDSLARWWRLLPIQASREKEPLLLREGPAVYRTKNHPES